MKTPHKHAELIKAWADGAEIQESRLYYSNEWSDWGDFDGDWYEGHQVKYRIKPEPKPDVVVSAYIPQWSTVGGQTSSCHWFEMTVPFAWKANYEPNIKLTFDGETGKLKSAEVL